MAIGSSDTLRALLLSNFDQVSQAAPACSTMLSNFIISAVFTILPVNQQIFFFFFFFFHYIPTSFKQSIYYLTDLTVNALLNM